MKKVAFPLAAWSFFALGGFILLLKAISSGQSGRIVCAAIGLAIAVSFIIMLLAQIKKAGCTR